MVFSSGLLVIQLLAPAQAPRHWHFETSGTATLDISNITGTVEVQGANGTEVTVDAVVQGGSEKEREGLALEVGAVGDAVTVRTCCGPCDKKLQVGSCPPKGVEVRYTVKVPAGSSVKAHSVVAPVTVQGVTGALDVETVNGNVRLLDTAAPVRVNTVSGRVELGTKALGPTSITTVSGDVRLALPAASDATVHLQTVSGKFNGRSAALSGAQETLGKGTAKYEVTTVSGSLDIKQGG